MKRIIIFTAVAALLIPGIAWGQACVSGWNAGAATPDAIFRAQACYCNGNVYVSTGRLDGSDTLEYMWTYDLAGDTWSVGLSLIHI